MTIPALGDIFVIPLSETAYVTGQVRLDVGTLVQERLLPPDSLLNAFRDTVLVDIFQGVTDMPFTEMSALKVSASPIRAARLAGICAHYAGRDDLVEERIRGNVWQTSLQHKDLRCSEHRAMIFDRAGVVTSSLKLWE